jgi:hypothetical protein
MEILNFLNGSGMFVLLGLFVVIVVLYNKLKARRFHKSVGKKK